MVTKTLKPFELANLYDLLTRLHEELDAEKAQRYRDAIGDLKTLIMWRIKTFIRK